MTCKPKVDQGEWEEINRNQKNPDKGRSPHKAVHNESAHAEGTKHAWKVHLLQSFSPERHFGRRSLRRGALGPKSTVSS